MTIDPTVSQTAWPLPGSGAASSAIGEVRVTDPRGNDTVSQTDQRGRVVRTTDARGIRQSTAYDAATGNRTSFTGRGGGTPVLNSYTADGFGLASVSQGGVTHEFDYSSDSFRADSYTTPQGNQLSYDYDEGGNIERITDPLDGTVEIERDDDLGLVRSMTDGNGNTTDYRYDDQRRLIEIEPPGGARPTTIVYDGLHRPVEVTDGNGNTTAYSYDAVDRVTLVEFDDGTSAAVTYDDNGQRTVQTDGSGSVTTGYDADGNVVSEVLSGVRGGYSYGYDAVGNLVEVDGPGGSYVYRYNAVNLVDRITEPGGHHIQVTYSSNSNTVAARTFPTSPNAVVETYTYDSSDRVTLIQARRGQTVLSRIDYDYDGELRVGRELFDGSETWETEYDYDELDRLVEASTVGGPDYRYRYDAASNRTARTFEPDGGSATTRWYGYDDANQLCWSAIAGTDPGSGCGDAPSGAEVYSHDGAGNLTGIGGLALDYDASSRTTSFDDGTGALDASYASTGQAQRVGLGAAVFARTILGVAAEVDTTSAGRVDHTIDPTGTILGLRRQDGAGLERGYLLTDGLGSTVAVVDGSGQVRTRYSYDPYGETTTTCPTGNCVEQPWRFAGEHQDPTGLYQIGERYYSPELGRWTQADPAANRINPAMPGEPNPYAYAACNPTNNTDPTGMAVGDYLSSCLIGSAFGAAAAKFTGGASLAAAAQSCGVNIGTSFVLDALGADSTAQLHLDLSAGMGALLISILSGGRV